MRQRLTSAARCAIRMRSQESDKAKGVKQLQRDLQNGSFHCLAGMRSVVLTSVKQPKSHQQPLKTHRQVIMKTMESPVTVTALKVPEINVG